MTPAIRFFCLWITEVKIPPPGKSFWVTNLDQKLKTNDGKRIVFKPAP